jgi:hypothetical protein
VNHFIRKQETTKMLKKKEKTLIVILIIITSVGGLLILFYYRFKLLDNNKTNNNKIINFNDYKKCYQIINNCAQQTECIGTKQCTQCVQNEYLKVEEIIKINCNQLINTIYDPFELTNGQLSCNFNNNLNNTLFEDKVCEIFCRGRHYKEGLCSNNSKCDCKHKKY